MDSPENRASADAERVIADLEGTRDALEQRIRELKAALYAALGSRRVLFLNSEDKMIRAIAEQVTVDRPDPRTLRFRLPALSGSSRHPGGDPANHKEPPR